MILGRSSVNKLAELWNIDAKEIINSWDITLQPTVLQHYYGTLNLRVERMLANYILEKLHRILINKLN